MKRYDPVNVCIYCGATEDLRDEHIIPLALNGDWVLPKASCRACEGVTSAFEGKVLRGPLWLPRLALGLRSRRRKSQPTSFPLEVIWKGKEETRDVPIHANLPSVVLPMFASPGFLDGSEVAEGVKIEGFYVGHIQRRPEDAVRELGVDKVALQMEYPVVEFARLVAKIGYAYAVAELGLERVLAPLVLPGIRGLSNRTDGLSNQVRTALRLLNSATEIPVRQDGSCVSPIYNSSPRFDSLRYPQIM